MISFFFIYLFFFPLSSPQAVVVCMLAAWCKLSAVIPVCGPENDFIHVVFKIQIEM